MPAASFVQIWSSSDFSVVQVTSVEKRESREHFSASAYGLGFKKLSLDSLFSTSVPWTTLQSDEDKFVLGLGSTIIETKYYEKNCKAYFLTFPGFLYCPKLDGFFLRSNIVY